MPYMSVAEYEYRARNVATAAWEISTGNGRDLDQSDWDSHMVNVQAAVANSYCEGMSDSDWLAATLARLGHN